MVDLAVDDQGVIEVNKHIGIVQVSLEAVGQGAVHFDIEIVDQYFYILIKGIKGAEQGEVDAFGAEQGG